MPVVYLVFRPDLVQLQKSVAIKKSGILHVSVENRFMLLPPFHSCCWISSNTLRIEEIVVMEK